MGFVTVRKACGAGRSIHANPRKLLAEYLHIEDFRHGIAGNRGGLTTVLAR